MVWSKNFPLINFNEIEDTFTFIQFQLSQQTSQWQSVRMETFWANNYLVEQLLPFLDLPSTVALASVHTVTASLIKRDFLWKQLLHQTFKTKSDFLVVYKEKVDLLITLIKQLDDVDEHQLHQSLFHHICKRFPPTSASSILMSCKKV